MEFIWIVLMIATAIVCTVCILLERPSGSHLFSAFCSAICVALILFFWGKSNVAGLNDYIMSSPFYTGLKGQDITHSAKLELTKCALIEQVTRCTNIKDKDSFLMSLDRKYLKNLLSSLPPQSTPPQKEEEQKRKETKNEE